MPAPPQVTSARTAPSGHCPRTLGGPRGSRTGSRVHHNAHSWALSAHRARPVPATPLTPAAQASPPGWNKFQLTRPLHRCAHHRAGRRERAPRRSPLYRGYSVTSAGASCGRDAGRGGGGGRTRRRTPGRGGGAQERGGDQHGRPGHSRFSCRLRILSRHGRLRIQCSRDRSTMARRAYGLLMAGERARQEAQAGARGSRRAQLPLLCPHG